MTFNFSRTLILQRLADGQFHSGEVLGKELGLSRAAVSKHIKGLCDLGLDIFSVTGKGYRLAKPLTLLEHRKIAQLLPQIMQSQINVQNVIDSTNQFIRDMKVTPSNGYVCLAEAQTAGRGRRGRTWVSPYGSSIYMSMFWSFAGGYQAINGLSLVIGIAVVRALQTLSVKGAMLKWPNDVYLQDKKLAGILVEVEGQMGSACDCILGIGLNIDLPTKDLEIDQPWIDLAQATGLVIDRNKLAATLIDELIKALVIFETKGLTPFISQWADLDYFYNKPVKLMIGNQCVFGKVKGIDNDGALLLERDGKIETYHGGEISVRPA
ncbi:bifunctional biotin--[acetyl-CoA-carboxylase] ligase/biotin operon repressor BirA [Aliiglaciecola sp. 3_MG-2023]|uniref:bifunctional biotin--[acetyl-CoA-carboxylase] ligase/biotin operon repressor BirA n=1 Tax=Aliiglaciecola sp. 3_MG-2023 TaxID=3062644 RepID=UPI0026E2ECD4|nr:bifunctional biotin--[acetyl-CoA-carboxylase] ligase/biotin operon repressor BirA [Aliiglaciecola sp. 3_MG-2023]MDO6695068.1 bifunctional biotin--[acetyl-CoA-carboxylase] ligase/biotin operon repressor BirA [Aliiglaciecola sp. 3_MG-2023]